MVMTVNMTTIRSLLLLMMMMMMMAGTSQSFTPAVHHYHNHHYYCAYHRHGQDEKHSTTTTALGVTVRPDASQAIQHALQVTKDFGPHSPQARLAWETVEELDSSTTPPPPATSATEKESSTTMVQEDYKVAIQSLSRLLHDSQETLSQIETLAKMLQQMELENPNLVMTTTTTNTIPNPKVQLVLQEAKAAAELYGFGSDQATQAWQVVESCLDSVNGNTEQADECNVESMYRYNAAALKAHHYYNAIVDTEFLQSSIQACEVLQQLRLYVKVESNRIN